MSTKKKPKKRKTKKANARSHHRNPNSALSEKDLERLDRQAWAAEVIDESEKIVPLWRRAVMNTMTDSRLQANVTAALALLPEHGQKAVACEEMAELTQLLARSLAEKDAPEDHIREEIADVYIILAQMARLYFEDQDQFCEVLNKKMAKQEVKLATAKGKLREML